MQYDEASENQLSIIETPLPFLSDSFSRLLWLPLYTSCQLPSVTLSTFVPRMQSLVLVFSLLGQQNGLLK